MGHSLEYLRKRERECRAAADKARDRGVRQCHLEFAERYAAQLEEALIVTAIRAD